MNLLQKDYKIHEEAVKETKKKISEKNKGRKLSQEQIEKLRSLGLERKLSIKTRRKISETHKRKGLYNAKAVKCLESNKTYKNMSEASRDTGISRDLIRSSCNDPNKVVKSTHWIFIDKFD